MMGRRQTNKVDRRIEVAYYATCSDVQLAVGDIGKVFQVGEAAIAAGADDTALQEAIRAYVETIRKN